MVSERGLEPRRQKPTRFKRVLSTNSNIRTVYTNFTNEALYSLFNFSAYTNIIPRILSSVNTKVEYKHQYLHILDIVLSSNY